MRVAVTGTTGYLGRFVVETLLGEGYTVVAQRRKQLDTSDPLTKFDSRLKLITGNMEDLVSLERLVQQCDAVVHMAFMSATGTYRGGEGEDPAWFWEQNFGGTLRLLQSCRGANVEKFIFLSSRAVFDGCDFTDRLVQDTDTPIAVNHYGLLKLASEKLSALYQDMTFCSLRPTGIYGLTWPCERTKWWNLVSDSKGEKRDLSAWSDSVSTEVHGADVATAIQLLLQQEHSEVQGCAFNCSDILVSDRYLVQVCQNLRNGLPADLNQTPLQSPNNVMGTEGLARLGWRAGGVKTLHNTLRKMIEMSEQLE